MLNIILKKLDFNQIMVYNLIMDCFLKEQGKSAWMTEKC